jgi:hypothetical protein
VDKVNRQAVVSERVFIGVFQWRDAARLAAAMPKVFTKR